MTKDENKMKYHVLIVDDDPNIRLGLQNLLLRKFGDQIEVKICENGAIATCLLSRDFCEIVITDIKMPVCSGIELLKNIKTLELSCHTIVLSGYDDYNLIRDALRLGAVDYLLKPVDFGLLCGNVRQIMSALGIERKAMEAFDQNPMLSQSLLEAFLVSDSANSAESIDFMDHHTISPDTLCILGYVDIKNILHSKKVATLQMLTRQLRDHCSRFFPDLILLNGEILSYWVFLGFLPSGSSGHVSFLDVFAEELEKGGLRFSFCCDPFALSCLPNQNRLCRVGFERYYFDLPYELPGSNSKDPEPGLRKAAACVAEYDCAGAMENLTHVFALFSRERPEIASIQKLMTNFVYDILSRNTKFISVISSSKFTEYDILEQIENTDCLSVLQKQVFISLNRCIELATVQIANRDEYMIRRAKEYISANYHESITLNDVAAHVFLQPNYFSTVFKNKTGTTFRQYLRSFRMEKARLIIEKGNTKVYDTALAVGYSDPAHFVRAFKEVYGISPSALRQNAVE